MEPEAVSGVMVTYQFQVDDDTWTEWKNTVPRSKSLDTRLRELIEADTEGRVRDETPGVSERAPAAPSPEQSTALDVEEPAHGATVPEVGENVREELRERLSGSGDLLERRVDETLKMYERLRELGEAEKSDLLAVVDVEATDYQDEDSVWANMVKGVLGTLPGVESPPSGKSTWRYTEER